MEKMTPTKHRIVDLSVEDCLARLGSRRAPQEQGLGRLVYAVDGDLQVRPLNYVLHQGEIIVRTGYGGLVDAVHRRNVLFEVDDGDARSSTGWSVIVRGVAEEVWRSDELGPMRELPLRPWAPGHREHYLRIVPKAITGRLLHLARM